ncbi:MAG: heavy-metal-associated domain-containing protein [Campylobacterota bacterium]|nr:heavy-metal-associated domain-containing protein [Campylobacterota bacterium]
MIETLELKDLNCGGSAATIRTALDIEGFTNVKVNLLNKPNTVSADINSDKDLELLKSVLRDHNFPLLDD